MYARKPDYFLCIVTFSSLTKGIVCMRVYVCGGGPIVNLHLPGQCNILAAAVVVNYRTRFLHSIVHDMHVREGHLDSIIAVVLVIIHLPRYFRSLRFMTCTPKITVCFMFSAKFKYYTAFLPHTDILYRRYFLNFNG